MSKRKEGESYEDYRARCTAASKGAKKRKGWMRWAAVDAPRVFLSGRLLAGAYSKKTNGPIPKLRFKKEHEEPENE